MAVTKDLGDVTMPVGRKKADDAEISFPKFETLYELANVIVGQAGNIKFKFKGIEITLKR